MSRPSSARIMGRRLTVVAAVSLLTLAAALVAPIRRPRSRPHRFKLDPSIGLDRHGRATCTCGSLLDAACHRRENVWLISGAPLDVARLAAGEREE